MYSYNVYPAPPYIIGAIGAKIGQLLGMQPSMGARLPGLIYGLVFINFLYLAAARLTRNKCIAIMLAAAIAFIPQVIYTLSYLNLDSFSLAASAVLGYAVIRYAQRPDRKAMIILGFAFGGLLSISKYSFFILAVPTIAVLSFLAIRSLRHRKTIGMLLLYILGFFILIGAFWYVRNTMLYHDPLGQSFTLQEMSKYHALGESKGLSLHSIAELEEREFLGVTFRSFFVAYGGMLYFISTAAYEIVAFILFCLAALTLTRGVQMKDKKLLLAWGVTILTLLLCITQSVYNSLHYDFQAQGRYIFPVLVPILLYLAYHWQKDKVAFRYVPHILLTTSAYIYSLGILSFIRIYL